MATAKRMKAYRAEKKERHECLRCTTKLPQDYNFANCEKCRDYINSNRHKRSGENE